MSFTSWDQSRKSYRAVSNFTQKQLLGGNELIREFNVPALQSTISFIIWEWEKSVFGLMNCHALNSPSKRSSGPVSDLKLFIRIFFFLPLFSLFNKELEGHPSEEKKGSRWTALTTLTAAWFLWAASFYHCSWSLKAELDQWLLRTSGFRLPYYFDQVEIPSFLEVSKLPNSISQSKKSEVLLIEDAASFEGRVRVAVMLISLLVLILCRLKWEMPYRHSLCQR